MKSLGKNQVWIAFCVILLAAILFIEWPRVKQLVADGTKEGAASSAVPGNPVDPEAQRAAALLKFADTDESQPTRLIQNPRGELPVRIGYSQPVVIQLPSSVEKNGGFVASGSGLYFSDRQRLLKIAASAAFADVTKGVCFSLVLTDGHIYAFRALPADPTHPADERVKIVDASREPVYHQLTMDGREAAISVEVNQPTLVVLPGESEEFIQRQSAPINVLQLGNVVSIKIDSSIALFGEPLLVKLKDGRYLPLRVFETDSAKRDTLVKVVDSSTKPRFGKEYIFSNQDIPIYVSPGEPAVVALPEPAQELLGAEYFAINVEKRGAELILRPEQFVMQGQIHFGAKLASGRNILFVVIAADSSHERDWGIRVK